MKKFFATLASVALAFSMLAGTTPASAAAANNIWAGRFEGASTFGTFTEAGATLKAPDISSSTCSGSNQIGRAEWIGFFDPNGDLLQVGFSAVLGIHVFTPFAQGWHTSNGVPHEDWSKTTGSFVIYPYETVQLSMNYLAGGALYSFTVTDVNQNKSWTSSEVDGYYTGREVGFISERPSINGQPLYLQGPGSTGWSNQSINGISAGDYTTDTYTMVFGSNTLMTTTLTNNHQAVDNFRSCN